MTAKSFQNVRFARLGMLAASASGLGIGFLALPAAAAPSQTAHGITLQLDFSSNPMTTLEPPPPLPPLSIPSSCPFTASAVFTITGNAVAHQSGNNNGFWAGATVEGAASLADGTASPYVGHLTAWTGFGTNVSVADAAANVPGQAEVGLTLDFKGMNAANRTLSVHIDWHGTMNNSGTVTAVTSHVTCR